MHLGATEDAYLYFSVIPKAMMHMIDTKDPKTAVNAIASSDVVHAVMYRLRKVELEEYVDIDVDVDIM